MKIGLFDADGKCIGLYSGAQDLSVLEFADAAEVGDDISPNEAHYDKEKKQVEKRPHIISPRPPRTTPSLSERLLALEDDVKKLKK